MQREDHEPEAPLRGVKRDFDNCSASSDRSGRKARNKAKALLKEFRQSSKTSRQLKEIEDTKSRQLLCEYNQWIEDNYLLLTDKISVADLQRRFDSFNFESPESFFKRLPEFCRPRPEYDFLAQKTRVRNSWYSLHLKFEPVFACLSRLIVDLGNILDTVPNAWVLASRYYELSRYTFRLVQLLCPRDQATPELGRLVEVMYPNDEVAKKYAFNLTKGFVADII